MNTKNEPRACDASGEECALMQDENSGRDGRRYNEWHASRPDARLNAREAAASIAGQEQAGAVEVHIDFKQATDLLDMFGGEPCEITLSVIEGHSGRGLYAHYTEYPEEGSNFLGVTDIEALPAAAPAAAPGAAIAAREQSPDEELLVACITLNGATLTIDPQHIAEMFSTDDEQYSYELTFKRMTRAAYEALGDFNGF